MPIRASMPLGTTRAHPRHTRPYSTEYFLRESHPRIMWINLAPARRAKHPSRTHQHGASGSRDDDQRAWRKELAFRHVGLIQHFHRRDFLRFLHLCQFKLLRKRLVNSFVNLELAEFICVRYSQKWQLTQSWIRIVCRALLAGGDSISGGRTSQLLQLIAQLGDAGLRAAYTNIVIGIDLSQAFELRLRSNHLALQRCGGLDHGPALRGDVDCRVLACKLPEILFR